MYATVQAEAFRSLLTHAISVAYHFGTFIAAKLVAKDKANI
jgi:hypothetical protein